MRRRGVAALLCAALPALVLLALALLAGHAQAEVQLAGVFGEHMVLQRERPIVLWGTARPGEALQAQFGPQRSRTVAGADGRWRITLPAQRAGGPHVLSLRGDNELTLRDLWVGDVWVCAGQSNMEWTVAQSLNGADEVARMNLPTIRQLRVPQAVDLAPRSDIARAEWQPATPATAGDFTAVGSFFARAVQRELGVPVGLINASWGGTQIESWLAADTLAAQPAFAEGMRRRTTSVEAWATRRRERALAQVRAWQPEADPADADPQAWRLPEHPDAGWRTLQMPLVWERQGLAGFDGVLWLRRSVMLSAEQAQGATTLSLGMVDDCDETWLNGQRVGGQCGWDTPRRYTLPPGLLQPGRNVIAVRVTDTGGDGGLHGDAAGLRLEGAGATVPLAGPWQARIEAPLLPEAPGPNDAPGVLFNTMIHPLLGLPVRGVLWYQGESNAERASEYATLFPLMIEDWRRRWGQGALPFYFVQLAAFQPAGSAEGRPSAWSALREAQAQALRLPHTGMAVAIDVGDAHDIHPRNKQAVGERLARIALRQLHGRAVVASGPRLRAQHRQGQRIVLDFDTPGSGLAVRGGGSLQGFELADASRRFVPAQARIVGHRVEVWQEGLARPQAVRYAWRDDPSAANLVNAAGLPAPPFRTDRWPLGTAEGHYAPE